MNRNWGDLVYCLATLAPLEFSQHPALLNTALLQDAIPQLLADLIADRAEQFATPHELPAIFTQQQLLLQQARQYITPLPLTLAWKQVIYLAAWLYPVVYGVQMRLLSHREWQHRLATARLILYGLGVPFKLRQQTLLLLLRYAVTYRLARRHHQQTPRRTQLSDATQAVNRLETQYLKLAVDVPLRVSYHFSQLLAATLSHCSQTTALTLLAQFQTQAQDCGLWEGTTSAIFGSEVRALLADLPANEQQRVYHWLIKLRLQGRITSNCAAARYLAADPQLRAPQTAHLYLAVGIPGAGKSTWFAQHLPQVSVISSDRKRQELFGDETFQGNNPRVFQECYRDLSTKLAAGYSVAFDATNVRRQRRSVFLRLAQNYFAHSTIVYFDLPVDLALQQNQQRRRRVAPPVIRQYFYELEEPRPIEAVHLNLVSTQQTDPHWMALNP